MATFTSLVTLLFAATMIAFVSWRICRGIVRLYEKKVLSWWETGYFAGWIGGGGVLAVLLGVFFLPQVFTHAGIEWQYLGTVFTGYGVSVWVGGPIGLLATAYHRITTRKREPKVLGCGRHGIPRLTES
jgi:hypothetical protein